MKDGFPILLHFQFKAARDAIRVQGTAPARFYPNAEKRRVASIFKIDAGEIPPCEGAKGHSDF